MKPLSFFALMTVLGTSGLAAPAAPSAIVVERAWSRPASDEAVVYATFVNRGGVADRLIAASSPIATHVGLHESTETKSAPTAMAGMQMGGGVMSMKAVSAIVVPARGSVTLQPGGYHLMVDLRHPIGAGASIPLRLHFARAGWIAATANVRPI
jgi:copper(I)-binding protein